MYSFDQVLHVVKCDSVQIGAAPAQLFSIEGVLTTATNYLFFEFTTFVL